MALPTRQEINLIDSLDRETSETTLLNNTFLQSCGQPNLLQGVIEDLINGVLILTDQKELVYADDGARRVLRQLSQDGLQANLIPKEIWHICHSLIRSRSLFPNQYWLIGFEILTDDSTALRIRARWLELAAVERPCLLLTVEDPYQSIKSIAIEEAKRYGLTSRETEVWLLHRAHYTYKKIASELCVTPNTIKKHMRSIHTKQRDLFSAKIQDQFDDDDE